jgi:hypothetical protein
MATFAERQLSKLHKFRGIAGQKGFRTHSATIVRTFSNDTTGAGDIVRNTFPVLEGAGQNPKVVVTKGENVPFGNAPATLLTIGPVTPSAELDDFLMGGLGEQESRFVVITGPMFPDGEHCRIVHVDATKPLRRMVYVQAESEALQGFT